MNQKEEIKLFMLEVMPYMANIEFIKNIFENVSNFDELEKKVKDLLKKDIDVTKKTDLKILLEKMDEYRIKHGNH